MAAVPLETRRAPRVAARCPATISFGAGRWEGETEDLGAGGCRFVARLALRPGEPVSLKLQYGGLRSALDVVGTVAWTAVRPPWRTGVSFARGQEEKARRFLRAVLSATPGLAAARAEVGFRSAPQPPPTSKRLPETLLAPRAARLRALLVAARSQVAAGNSEQAIHELRDALALAPEDAEVHAALRALGVPGPE